MKALPVSHDHRSRIRLFNRHAWRPLDTFRAMTSRAFLLLGFLIILLISIVPVHAETIPSTANTVTVSDLQESWDVTWTGGLFPDQPSACSAGCTAQAASSSVSESSKCVAYTSHTTTTCKGTLQGGALNSVYANLAKVLTCADGSSWNGSDCVTTTYSCPAGYTMSEDQQSCTKTSCSPGDIASKGVYYGETVTSPACINGCAATYSGQQPWDSASGWIYIGQYKNTGQTCAEASEPPSSDVPTPTAPESTDPPTTAEYDCVSKGMSYGSANGVTVCVPSGTPNTPPMVEPPQTTSKENPDGTTTETQTQDSQNGTNVTRNTTVITRDAQGNVVSEETTSVTATQAAFCEENPNSSVCAESKTSGGGNCDTPPSSEGDAIQAAILKQSWETRCEVKKGNDAVTDAGTWGQEQIDAASNVQNPIDNPTTFNVSTMFDQTDLLGSHACPAPKVIQVLGRSYSLPFDQLCDLAAMIGNLIMIFATFLSFRIVIGAL